MDFLRLDWNSGEFKIMLPGPSKTTALYSIQSTANCCVSITSSLILHCSLFLLVNMKPTWVSRPTCFTNCTNTQNRLCVLSGRQLDDYVLFSNKEHNSSVCPPLQYKQACFNQWAFFLILLKGLSIHRSDCSCKTTSFILYVVMRFLFAVVNALHCFWYPSFHQMQDQLQFSPDTQRNLLQEKVALWSSLFWISQATIHTSHLSLYGNFFIISISILAGIFSSDM